MCIDFNGHHSDGSSFVYVNDFCYYKKCLYTNRYKFISEKKNKKKSKESQYMVSHPGNRGVTVTIIPLKKRIPKLFELL